jgi:predicted hotdog family 3-hydroxylacyl-ACP dehydratase
MRWLPDDALVEDTVHVTVPPDNLFLRDGHLLPAALIEYLAQAAAARLSIREQGRRLRQGVLVAIKDFNFHHPVPAGTPLILRSTRQKAFGPFSTGYLEAHAHGTLIATAHMTFHLTFE